MVMVIRKREGGIMAKNGKTNTIQGKKEYKCCEKIKKCENLKKTLDRGMVFKLYYNIDGVFPDGGKISVPMTGDSCR